MTSLARALAPVAIFLAMATSVPVKAQDYADVPLAKLQETAASEHPSALYVLASRLFDTGARSDAVFWYYAGQLRYRIHLQCNPDLAPDGDPALFGALSEVIGNEINRYAFGDVEALAGTLEAVVEWDEATENPINPREKCPEAHMEVVSGLQDLRGYLLENVDLIRDEREQAGLDNTW
ncbi:hypothetical protein [Pelagibacterium montanilacus]|uniref:hypothetical protein n=1 Tax=Pelagibacterium montanilacus TaxID=2185280 RepID=UPI000F8F7D94|nr:hypothetical protein [Pelagibacterium montanilacus]